MNGGFHPAERSSPVVVLPDNYMYIEVGEKNHENAMEWTEIEPQTYTHMVKIENLPSIVEKSKKR